MTALSEKAMLVRLKRHLLGVNRRDKLITDETTERKGAAKDAGTWTTKIFPKESMSAVRSAASQIKLSHELYTLPWLGDGTRILPAQLYEKYMEKMDAAIAKFNQNVEEWIRDDFPRLSQQASKRLADLMTTEIRIPTAEEARRKFSIEHDVFPMPDVRDFRCGLGANSKVIEKRTQEAIDRLTQGAVNDIYKKLTVIVEKIVKTLSDKDAKFKNSLIGNLKDLVGMIPVLNLNDDPELERLRKECEEQLANIDPQRLRDSKRIRKQTADKAACILDSIRMIDLDLE